jgi:hypothetical protein
MSTREPVPFKSSGFIYFMVQTRTDSSDVQPPSLNLESNGSRGLPGSEVTGLRDGERETAPYSIESAT